MTSSTDVVGSSAELLQGSGPTAGPQISSKSAWQLFWARFKDDKVALGGAVVIVLLIVIALIGGPIAAKVTGHSNTAAYTETMEDEFGIPKGPNNDFWFGADGTGFRADETSRRGHHSVHHEPADGVF